jgi:hypothetical protein
LLILGEGSHLNRESEPSPIGLVCATECGAEIVEEYGSKIVEAQQEVLVAL